MTGDPVDPGAERFTDIRIGPACDTFGGALGERNARPLDVSGYPFLARYRGDHV